MKKVVINVVLIVFVLALNFVFFNINSERVAHANPLSEYGLDDPLEYDTDEVWCFDVNDDPNLPIYEYTCIDGDVMDECIDEDCP